MSHNITYHVRPRYTPGSPAMIDRVLALRLAQQEARAYYLAHVSSLNPDYHKAMKQGSAWIVWTSWESHGVYHRKCLITGEVWKQQMRPHTPIPDPPIPNYEE